VAFETRRGGPNIPEPTALGAVGYWETVVVVLVQIGYQAPQICAILVVKPQLYLKDTFSFKGLIYVS
jgi:hypothetical protein